MLIKEIDFTKINQHKNTNVIPVFMQYGNECYEIATTKNHVENSWPIFQKLFYYKFYLENTDYLNSLFEQYLFSNEKSRGRILFSRSDKTFHNELSTDRDTASKFGTRDYVCQMPVKYHNLVVLKKVVKETALKDFRLFVTTSEEIEDSGFKKELSEVKKQFTRKKKNPYKIKKGNLVVGHINGIVLSDEEKLIKYVRAEFKKKNLLGDIVLSSEQEIVLNRYMSAQLERFSRNASNFKPEYGRVFALALVRYAMKNYNTKGKADFWPYFKTDYNVSIPGNDQKFIHSIFENLMKRYGMVYSETVNQKIDNITMHSFVADHSANQLFDYLFDFWRLDLGRNSDNLNTTDKGDSDFGTLIDAMQHGTQDVMTHTSLLLNFAKTKPAFKNRVKRIIRLMNDAFWNDALVNETGNRINHLLNVWIENPKGAFQKEKNYVAKHTSKEKGEILFHSPVFNVNYQDETLRIILPHQRLIGCIEEDKPRWIIKCSNSEFETREIPTNEHYKHDKIGRYVERMIIEVPLHLMLSGFEFSLMNEDKELKKYKIQPSCIRFFDEKGKYVDHKNAILPTGYVTAYSDNEAYPEVLGETNKSMKSDGLIMKSFNLVMGQIITLDDGSGVQVGQKLTEGLNETYPISGAELIDGGSNYKIYASLPKLLFKANGDDLKGISLVINGKQNKIVDKPVSEFKISKELKTSGYLIDLADYISSEGLYRIALSYPKMHKQMDIGSLAFIKGFNFMFVNAPYIFEEYGKIKLERNVKIDKNTKENDGTWTSDYSGDSFSFNFGERNENSENYCDLVQDCKLVLRCNVGSSIYPIHFEIPALYWKFSADDEWNSRQPVNTPLKEFKNKLKRLYITGPFNLSKSVITTTDDVDIAEEESEIKLVNGKNRYFEIDKVYNWFKNDRTETYRKLFITLDDKRVDLLNVICKSRLKNISLIGDFDNNILKGSLDIEGDENYTISIYHNGKTICEDEQVTDNQFSIVTDLETGNYEINVYEISEDDDDGFDVGTESILLNSKPIVKKLINLNSLDNQEIILRGYQDKTKKFMPRLFAKKYVIKELEKISYTEFLNEETESEIYGIWNENIDYSNEEEMNGYILYKGRLGAYKFDGTFQQFMKVLVLFTDKMQPESIIVLAKDADGVDFGSLVIDKSREWIVPGFQYNKMTKYDKKKCDCFYDDQSFYLIEIEEARL